MQQRGKAPVDWGSKAASVQTVAWPQGDGSWATADLEAAGPILACHPLAHNLHADVPSASAEIYAGGVGFSQGLGMWLSYRADWEPAATSGKCRLWYPMHDPQKRVIFFKTAQFSAVLNHPIPTAKFEKWVGQIFRLYMRYRCDFESEPTWNHHSLDILWWAL